MATSNPIPTPPPAPSRDAELSDQEIISASRQVDERFLTALTRRIVAVSGATRVILFGSRARHEERADSDVDLFVIVPGAAEERDAKRRALAHALFDRWIPLDIIVRSEADVRRATALGDPFAVEDVLREGRVLYAG